MEIIKQKTSYAYTQYYNIFYSQKHKLHWTSYNTALDEWKFIALYYITTAVNFNSIISNIGFEKSAGACAKVK